MATNSPSSLGGGNSVTPPKSAAKKKQSPTGKKWIMVWNNFDLDKYNKIDELGQSTYKNFMRKIEKECSYYILSDETGESGTRHIQGYVEFLKEVRPRLKMENPFCHWGDKDGKPCRGTREENVSYVRKEDVILLKSKNCIESRKLDFSRLRWCDWQKDIVQIVEQQPCFRSIYWYWGGVNLQKTYFCKYLTMTYDAIPLGSTDANMKNGVIKYKELNDELPTFIIYNFVKSQRMNKVCYKGIEAIKDMYFFSGKYEGGSVCGPEPHIIIMANNPPDMSSDEIDWKRFIVREIF